MRESIKRACNNMGITILLLHQLQMLDSSVGIFVPIQPQEHQWGLGIQSTKLQNQSPELSVACAHTEDSFPNVYHRVGRSESFWRTLSCVLFHSIRTGCSYLWGTSASSMKAQLIHFDLPVLWKSILKVWILPLTWSASCALLKDRGLSWAWLSKPILAEGRETTPGKRASSEAPLE